MDEGGRATGGEGDLYDDRRMENDNMIFHRSRNFISFRYVRAICLLKWNVVVDCHGNGHKNNASHIYLLLSEGCYQAIEKYWNHDRYCFRSLFCLIWFFYTSGDHF